MDDLEQWLERDYAQTYRTACLVWGDPARAEEAVKAAFLRVWRFRGSLPDGVARTPWLYRVLLKSAGAATAPSAFGELPDSLRIPLILHLYAGLSDKQIATALARPAATVRSRLHEARRRLADCPGPALRVTV